MPLAIPNGAQTVGSDQAPSVAVAQLFVHDDVAALTVKVVLPTIEPLAALMLLVPAATPVARPPALIVAVAVVAEAQVTEPVRSVVEASL